MSFPISPSKAPHERDQPVPGLQHRTVLLDEAVDALGLEGARASGTYIDGTFGRGGHSRLILSKLAPEGRLIAFDKDLQAIATAEQIERSAFFDRARQLRDDGRRAGGARRAQVDGILLDLGISSPQVDDASRGFSFRNDGPLDMRMDTTRGISAAEWLAEGAGTTTGKGDSGLWGRTVCFSDCKGDCCSPGSRANFKHTTACRNRGKRGQNPGERQGSGNPHLSGYPDFHQSRA
jgi:hypothetical protein